MNDEEQRIIEHAANVAVPLARPDHIYTHAWLDRNLQMGDKPPATVDYEKWHLQRFNRIDAWREEMLVRHNIDMKTVAGHGLRVVAAQDTARDVRVQSTRDLRKTLRKASMRLMYSDPTALNAAQVRERNEVLGHMGMVQQAIETARPRPPRQPGSPVRRWEQRLIVESDPATAD